MKLAPETKGYVAAIVATLALSNVYVFSKAALNRVHLAQFGMYWFGFALIWNLLYISFRQKKTYIRKITPKQRRILIITGILEIFSTTLFFSAIHFVENPAIVSFIGNIGPVFVGVMGFFFLTERFNSLELFGIGITIFGAFVISFRPDFSFLDFYSEGLLFVLGSNFISAIATIITKKNILLVEPVLFSINRSIYLFIFSVSMFIVLDLDFQIPTNALINIGMGSLLGPFLAILANYVAMQYLEASRTAIILSTKSLFVLLGAYFYFETLANSMQIIGGGLTIVGLIVITSGKKLKQQLQKRKIS